MNIIVPCANHFSRSSAPSIFFVILRHFAANLALAFSIRLLLRLRLTPRTLLKIYLQLQDEPTNGGRC
ncbi:unnamed protein product [Citrullus colocynthis]|uniref:Uncharacterized protein n=1 Tax=Citrullus colocynthis TaxID=252529 RepID=A0ABP0YW86_9ROSI